MVEFQKFGRVEDTLAVGLLRVNAECTSTLGTITGTPLRYVPSRLLFKYADVDSSMDPSMAKYIADTATFMDLLVDLTVILGMNS